MLALAGEERAVIRIPPVVVGIARREHPRAVDEHEVHWQLGRNLAPPAQLTQDLQRTLDGARGLLGTNRKERVLKLGEHQRVDPLGVGRALDEPGEQRINVLQQVIAHATEVVQVAVLGECEARALEQKRVDIVRANALAAAIKDSSHVRNERTRRTFPASTRRFRSKFGSVGTR